MALVKHWPTLLLTLVIMVAVLPQPQEQTYRYYVPLAILPNTARGVTLKYRDCADVGAVGATWAYDWSVAPPLCPGVESVPMISCKQEAEWLLFGQTALGGNSEWVMLFNEPDLILPISPVEGARLYRVLEPHLKGRRIVAPAPSESGIEWLPEFRAAYAVQWGHYPRLDALAVHCYSNTFESCRQVVAQFVLWAHQWGVPEVWVTEFAFVSSEQDAVRFMRWLRDEPRVTRFAWFTNRDEPSALVAADGELTRWGRVYREVK